jgi:hypothetical protein
VGSSKYAYFKGQAPEPPAKLTPPVTIIKRDTNSPFDSSRGASPASVQVTSMINMALYETKLTSLNQSLAELTKSDKHYKIPVSRSALVEDSFKAVFVPVDNIRVLRSKLWVEFDDEKAYDYTGLSKEWFQLLSKEVFSPFYGLFEYSAVDDYTLQINPNSELLQADHLDYFQFVGRITGR